MRKKILKSLRSTRLNLSRPATCPVRRKPLPKIYEKEEDPEHNEVEKFDSDKETTNSCPVKKKFARPLPRLPFCEEYDGVNMRKTSTISQSIVELLASQKKEREANMLDDEEVEYKSTRYFDRLEDFQNIFKSTSFSAYPESPSSCMTYSSWTESEVSLDKSFDPFDDIRVKHDDSEGICTIDLELEHMYETNRLVLKVVKAEDVTDRKYPNKLINTFVKVSMYHGKKNKKQRTEVVTKSRDPVFNHTFYMDNVSEKWMHLMCLRVQLYQKTCFRKVCIGETLIWLDDLEFASQKQVTITENLREPFL